MNVEQLQSLEWFRELVQNVQAEISRLQDRTPNRRQAQLAEREALEAKSRGWIESLSKPNLDSRLREAIETQFQQAKDRIDEISSELSERDNLAARSEGLLDPALVVTKLNRLAEVLGGDNPSAGNVMLSHHIEGIDCDRDGRVVVRTCKLGALAGVMELLPRVDAGDKSVASQPDAAVSLATPRKRARLDIGAAIENDDDAGAAIEFATDPNRFAGLGAEWFTEDWFQVPNRVSWAEEHANEVADYRIQTGATMEVTANHFEKTMPTIRRALRYAKAQGIQALGKEISLKTRSNWARDNADVVAEYLSKNSMAAAVEHFQKSDTTLRQARKLAGEVS